MFPLHYGILLGGKLAEECMRMCGAGGKASGAEAIDLSDDFCFLCFKIRVAGDNVALICRAVFGEWLFSHNLRLKQCSQNTADEAHSLREIEAQRGFQRSVAMCEHLVYGHLAPLPLRLRGQFFYACYNAGCGCRVK